MRPASPLLELVPDGGIRRSPLDRLRGAAGGRRDAGPAHDGIGGKARHLRWLAEQGLAVPEAVVVPYALAEELATPHAAIRGEAALRLRSALVSRVDPALGWAVRSSAEVEDGADASYAGRFTTCLDVRTLEELVDAVELVVGSARGVVVDASGRPPRMAVVVQRQVDATTAGVAFSRNPLTGLDEVVVEAVPGLGDALVQDGVTPDRWVHRWGELTERPVEPRTDPDVIEAVARGTRRIAAAYGRPVDVEWAHDGTTLWWLQVRPITALGDVALYSNRIAKEVLPGLIPPLVWSLNVPVVNRAWVDLFTEAIGPNSIEPERLARAFGYRAYFDMGAIGEIFVALGMPRDSLELLLGLAGGTERPRFRPTATTWRRLPRLAGLALRLNGADARYRREVPLLAARLSALDGEDPAAATDAALVERLEALIALTREVAYANIVVPLLMNLYGGLIRRRATALGLDAARIDPARDLPALRALDPRHHLGELHDALAADPGSEAVAVALAAFLERFGHLGDRGSDVSSPRWREDPAGVLRMALEPPPSAPVASLGWEALAERSSPLGRPLLRRLYRRAATFRQLREEVSFEFTRSFAAMRRVFLVLGERLVARGALDGRDDVFLLSLDELLPLVRDGIVPGEATAATLVARRRAEMAAAEGFDLPELIIGDDFVPRRRVASELGDLRGVPASRGTFRGPARIVRSAAEVDRVRPGDVLVVPFSDVAWTPLFARAGAVVAEAGGMLSHSAIVAREHGIPCVVSVPNATGLPEDAILHVDGYRGIVTVESAA